MLGNEQQLRNTEQKLAMLEQQIARAKGRGDTAGNRESIVALTQMANQMREEITRFRSREKRRAS
ncbi:MAG: hypothetical protein NTU53_01990 [Planctomycetota bacterium]|nr:hypothetical protein [Planctomycetota bacterium]